MSESLIPYDEMIQEALKGVVRNILERTAVDGLPGNHHFYIAFRTHDEGVQIPQHLMEKYPDDMTIVLQHRFWGLKIHEDRFEVGLSFNHQPELLVIPFAAVIGFVDPTAQFALELQNDDEDEGAANDAPSSALQNIGAEGASAEQNASARKGPEASPAASPAESPVESNDDAEALEADVAEALEAAEAVGGDNVVALDAFRKKT